MGSVRDAYDNRLCETYFATLECELLERLRFATRLGARQAIVSSSSKVSATCPFPLPALGILARGSVCLGRRTDVDRLADIPA